MNPRTCVAAAGWSAALMVLAACGTAEPEEGNEPVPAELVVLGNVLTLDVSLPRAEALVVRGGLVERVCSRKEALEEVGPVTRVLEVPPGGVAMPGIVESHAHLLGVGRSRRILDLRGVSSAREAARLAARRAARSDAGAWVLGRGWNQELWEDDTLPDRDVLDAAVPGHPVALTRVDGHALWVNSAALDAAGIQAGTRSPAGGEILNDPEGRPTGILVDRAMDLVERLIPPETDPEVVAADVLAAQELALGLGITTFVDAGTGPSTLEVLRRLYGDGKLQMRIYAMRASDGSDVNQVTSRPPLDRLYDDHLSVRAVKLYADGALGSRGAWLLEPYADRPGHAGLPIVPPERIARAARLARERGYQLCVHAIGDRANRRVLDAFEEGLGGAGAAAALDHRFRIEHAQILDAEDIPRFRLLGVLPSMQACHATSDAAMALDRLGAERVREGAYAWRSLIDSGTIIPNGTDAPVEPLSPWENLFAAVWRGPQDPGAEPFTAEQRMNRLEALFSLTTWGAYGIFAERRRGRLRPGFQADLVICDRDPLTCSVWRIPETQVLATVVGGRVVHEASSPGGESDGK